MSFTLSIGAITGPIGAVFVGDFASCTYTLVA